MSHTVISAVPESDLESQRIDIGGRSLAMTCQGHGPVTVLLETGLGAESAEWAAVQARLSRTTRVCRYDRANRGASEPASTPRTSLQMLEDLEWMLACAAIPGPYVAVGHSFGGVLARLFAARHRDDVIGLVLVDSMHPDQFTTFAPSFPPPSPGEPAALTAARAFHRDGWRRPESTAEGIDLPTSLEQDRALGSLGALPVRILVADTMLRQDSAPPALRPALQRQWDELQSRFLSLSSNTRLTRAPGCGHFVQREAPDRVAEAVESLLAELGVGRERARERA